MKRIASMLAIVFILPLAGFPQDPDLAKLFNQYKNVQGFELSEFDPNINISIEEELALASFLDEVEKIYILNFNHETGKISDLNEFTEKLYKLLKKKKFESMIDVNSDEKVAIRMRKGNNEKYSDFFIAAIDNEDASFVWAMTP